MRDMEKILLVVDMQNDFVTGSLGSERALEIVPRVRAKIKEYSKNGYKIIFTRDSHGDNYLETQEGKNLPVEHCIAGTDGWRIYGGLDDADENHFRFTYVDKPSFGWPKWNETFERVIGGGSVDDVGEIEICGLCTDICVVSNALILKAMFPEIKITVDAGCCAGVTEESHRAALQTMKMCQVNVVDFDL